MLGTNTLFVKHLPAEFSPEDREEFLKLYDAVKVRVMPDTGKMKYTAFATFKNYEDAKHALQSLHQKKVLNKHLVVEFAKQQHETLLPHLSDFPPFRDTAYKEAPNKPSEKEILRLSAEEFSRKLHGVAPTLGLDYLPSPLIKYKYPPPTPIIIQNISHALVSVNKFYVQVLHLMNKMNLPAPFGPLTPAPPIAPDILLQPKFEPLPQQKDLLVVENMELTTSEEESEYESDKEEEQTTSLGKVIPENLPIVKPKKKRKLKAKSVPIPTIKKQRTEPSDVFDAIPLNQKKISMKNIDQIIPAPASFETTGGFGEIEPSREHDDDDDDEQNIKDETPEEWDRSNFIMIDEIKRKRMSSREMKNMSIFRNYSPGEPSCRLYIKNLAKQVKEKDLRYIFGRFINWNSEVDKTMFDIKLMKEGRMKGQAFITLGNEKQAKDAVRETNGFILHTKPLVVQFARSAKPKEDKKDNK